MPIYIICNRGIQSFTTEAFHLSTSKSVDIYKLQARSQDFSLGGGGGGSAYLKKGNQIFNVGLIRYASSEDAQGSASSLLSCIIFS